ncbi:hypothetical protein V8G54_009501 [Vigna mungo]|uniref:Uncharacterized protein n=1 Tax=Vigna mungo TaxID=3915 RepID=A0AAQ3S5J1_VIGMU
MSILSTWLARAFAITLGVVFAAFIVLGVVVKNSERLGFFAIVVVDLGIGAWMDTSYITQMNSLLQLRHQNRISGTPFKMCLRIQDPLELNLKLLKLMVRRWIPHHQAFRVRQQLVPLNVQHVVMTLGFGVGGLEVPLDESIVGKVGEPFTNSKRTKLKDLIKMFNVLVHNDDLDVDVVCRCSREEEAPEKEGDDSSQLAVVDRIRRNSQRIRSLRDKIVVVRKELKGVEGEGKENCAGEEVVGKAHDEAVGQANEAPANEAPTTEAPADEAPVNEERAAEGHEEAAHEEPIDEERASEPHEEGPADAHEEAAGHVHAKATDEEPVREPLDPPPPFIDMGDDDDDGHVEPLVVVPLRTLKILPLQTFNHGQQG